VNEDICPLYLRLLQDTEPQVRKASILALNDLLPTSNAAFFANEVAKGPLQTLANDSQPEVREALAQRVASLGKYMEKQQAKDKLLPVLKNLAGDESAQARLNLCSNLAEVASILGIELFESDILPLLKEVTIDQKWRVRNSIVQNVGAIGIQMGMDKFAKSRLRDILVQSLKDPASTVRDTAIQQVQMLHKSFGFDWMQKNLFPDMKKIYKESGNYLHRMVPLKAVRLMAGQLTPKEIKLEFAELLMSALDDPISNVRFTACRVLKNLFDIEPSFAAMFKSKLEKMSKDDDDNDVRYFATSALSLAS